MALISMLMGLLALLVVVLSKLYLELGFWVGLFIAMGTIIALAILSIRKARRGFSDKDIKNIEKTQRNSWIYILLAIGIYLLLASISIVDLIESWTDEAAIIGFASGFFLSGGMIIIMDNYIWRSLFLWNIDYDRAKKAYYGKHKGN